MTTQLYLVRHGETNWNREHRIQGLTDIPLNDTGRAQALVTGELLARRQWDGVYSSPLMRAFETASIIATATAQGAPQTIDTLVERNYGDAEGLDFGEIDRRYPDRGDVPGQESREAVVARVIPALEELASAHPDESLIVVSHGGAIRAVLTAVDPANSHGMIANGSVHSFSYDGDGLRLIAFDDPIGEDCVALDEQNAVEAREDVA